MEVEGLSSIEVERFWIKIRVQFHLDANEGDSTMVTPIAMGVRNLGNGYGVDPSYCGQI